MSNTMAAVILAGGSSRRMGRDKALLPSVRGATWLDQIVKTAWSRAGRVIVTTGTELRYQDREFPAGTETILDSIPGAGPLGGIATAMEIVVDPFLLCLTCDMPDLTSHEIDLLGLPVTDEEARITGETFFPMVIRTSLSVRESLLRSLRLGHFSVGDWVRSIRSKGVSIAIPNRNEPGDLFRVIG